MQNTKMNHCILLSFVLCFFSFSSQILGRDKCTATYDTILMGTNITITIKAYEEQKQIVEKAIDRAISQMENLVYLVSSWEPSSETSRINESAGTIPVSVDRRLINILLKSQEVSELSDGAFDITFSGVGKLWKLSPENPVVPSKDQIDQAKVLVNYRNLIINKDNNTALLTKKGMRIDLGGIAKGSVVDVGARSLLKDGINDFLINAGGDLRIHSSSLEEPWSVGITNPRDPGGPVMAIAKLSKGSIVTSGNYEKMVEINGKRYHHIINPKTGYPVDHCISVTVVAPDAETADSFSTAFFVMGPEKGLELCEKLKDIEALFVDNNFNISSSSEFPEIEMLNNVPNIQQNKLELSGKE